MVARNKLRRAEKANASRAKGSYVFSGSKLGGGMKRQAAREQAARDARKQRWA